MAAFRYVTTCNVGHNISPLHGIVLRVYIATTKTEFDELYKKLCVTVFSLVTEQLKTLNLRKKEKIGIMRKFSKLSTHIRQH